MNYIGIRGHRGAGKKSIAYLLGQTIDYLIENEGKLLVGKTYDELYEQWVEDVMTNEDVIHDIGLDNVYFDSFADTLKLFVELLTGIPNEYIYNDHYKDHVVINIRDFSYTYYEEIPDTIQLLTRDELYKLMPKDSNPITIMKNLYMTLREFILYFGIDVMQRFLGLNVWVKSLRQSEERLSSLFNEDNMYKIFSDVKTPSEVTYILDRKGCIVHVIRPSNKKKSGGFDKLSKDGRVDYTIHVGGNLSEIKSQILEIAKQIISRNGKG